MKIILANPRGFCAGVDRAIEIVERALNLFAAPVYVRHEVVHNKYVVNCLRDKGAVFIEELAEVPEGAVLIHQMKSLDFENRQVELIEKAPEAVVEKVTELATVIIQ